MTHLLDIVSSLGAGLNEHDVEFLGLALAFLNADLALVRQIGLVANEHDNDILAALCPHIVNPLGSLLERVAVWQK